MPTPPVRRICPREFDIRANANSDSSSAHPPPRSPARFHPPPAGLLSWSRSVAGSARLAVAWVVRHVYWAHWIAVVGPRGVSDMKFTDVMDHVAQGFEAFGAAVLICGLIWSMVVAVRVRRSADGPRAYRALRETFGGALLLSLEILVAADLIR